MGEADTSRRNTTASTPAAAQSTTSPTAQGPAGEYSPRHPRHWGNSRIDSQKKRRISRPRTPPPFSSLTSTQIRTRTDAASTNANAKPETRVAGDPLANPAAGEEKPAGAEDYGEEGEAEEDDEGGDEEEGEVDETIPMDESDETTYPTISDGQGSGHANKVGTWRGREDQTVDERAVDLQDRTEKPAAIAQAWRETPAQTTTPLVPWLFLIIN